MSSRTTRVLRRGLLALGVLAGAAFVLGPGLVAGRLNPTLPPPARAPSAEAVRLHATLRVADLHTDALLWDRALLDRTTRGHVDLARLAEGGVTLQAFTAVTKTPWGINVRSNAADSDQILPLAILQLWPPRTWTDLTERALHQAAKLERAAAASDGRLVIVRTRADLDAVAASAGGGESVRPVAAILGVEGAHALEGDVERLDRLFDAGFRMLGLTHFFDNAVGGSAHGLGKGGLTELGREILDRADQLGMIVDLAHASPRLIDDVLAHVHGAVVVSHTGVAGTCPGLRNLDDGRLGAIAASGGVVGIGLWPGAVCGDTVDDWARAVRHAADVMGPEHVALGSDWDGAVPAIVDAAGTVHLTDALLRAGFRPAEIRGIMGGNTIRVLRSMLPEGHHE